MRSYLTFFRIRLVNGFQYRTAAFAAIFTQFFWGFIEILLYRAFYTANAAAFPMGFSQVTSYIWLRQAFLALFNTWSFETELFDMILNGNVAYELCRPVGLYGMWFARTTALRISRAALRCAPILLVAALLPEPLRLQCALSPAGFLGFLASMALALGVTVAFVLIVYFSCFYTVSADGIRNLLAPISDFLSGGLLPLPFMPLWLSTFIGFTPFAAMQNAPLRVFSGDIAGGALTQTLLMQLFWLAALCALGHFMQKRGMRRLSVQGG